jgi:hypothetical protein
MAKSQKDKQWTKVKRTNNGQKSKGTNNGQKSKGQTMAKSQKDKQWPKVKRTGNKQSLYTEFSLQQTKIHVIAINTIPQFYLTCKIKAFIFRY